MAGKAERQERIRGILKPILIKNGFSDTLFFIGGYSEDAFCLEYEDGKWQTYTAYRGRKASLSVHKEERSAVKAFINMMCYEEEKAQRIYDEFVVAYDTD